MTAKDINDYINKYFPGYSFNFRSGFDMIDGAFYISLDESPDNVFDRGRYDSFDRLLLSRILVNDISKLWIMKEDILIFMRNRKLENLLNEV